LAARIVALRDSPDRLARYAEAGLRRVHAAYTVEHMARAWLDLVHSILG
jgi:spore maturation protein CgeB